MKRLWERWSAWWRTSTSTLARWLRAADSALLGEMPVLAGGTALYAIIAVVPTLAAVVSVYGLVADPSSIRSHLAGLETLLPPAVVDFLGGQLERQAERSSNELLLQIGTSVLVATWSARGAANALMTALNRAYRVREQRGTLHRLAISFALAAATIFGLIVVLAVVVALPAIFAVGKLSQWPLVRWLRWPFLLGILFASLLGMYRVAPSPRPLGTERHLWPGAAIATALLVGVSWALSLWVERVADYEVFYGTFASVIIIILWFYLSTLAIVIGGFVNAELERTAGAPEPNRSMY
jgi:membrane protein